MACAEVVADFMGGDNELFVRIVVALGQTVGAVAVVSVAAPANRGYMGEPPEGDFFAIFVLMGQLLLAGP